MHLRDLLVFNMILSSDMWLYFMALQFAMFVVFGTVNALLFILTIQITSLEDCKNKRYISAKVTSVLFAIIKSFIKLPCFYIFVYCFSIPIGKLPFNQYVALLILNTVNFFLFILTLVFFNKICCLKIPI